MKDMHNLGIFDSLVKVWDSYPYGGCPGDYVVIGGEVVYWNDERRVWGDFGSDISSDKNQIVEGNLTIEKNLTIGGDTKGNTADFKKIVAETLNIKNPPYALKVHNHDDVYALSKHKHQLEDIIESGEGVVVPGKIENAKYADVAYDLDKNSPGNRRFISRLNDDTASGLITFLKGLISEELIEANNGINIGEAIDSLISGSGTLLRPNGSIQADSVELRKSLTVLELIFNRLSAQEGDATYSESE